MSVQLNTDDFRHLSSIVQKLPTFGMERDRRALVSDALEGSERADSIMAQLDVSGPPMVAATNALRLLQNFGQVVYGKEAIGIFVTRIADYVDADDADFLHGLVTKYEMNVPTAARSTRTVTWRGQDKPEDVREKILGDNTLQDIRILQIAFEASRPVVHITVPASGGTSYGTGFMIAPDLLITNNHVLQTPEQADVAIFQFNYQMAPDGTACPPQMAKRLANGAFRTNAVLDYTVVQLADLPDFGKPLKMNRVPVKKDDRVAIIQHPGGHMKQISLQNNFVAFANNQVVQYTTSTLPGSSGSPVFNNAYEVVALHHAGGSILGPDTQVAVSTSDSRTSSSRYDQPNEGVSVAAIIADLRASAPEIAAQVGG